MSRPLPTAALRFDIEPTNDAARYVWRWTVMRDGIEVGSGRNLHLTLAMDDARNSAILIEALREP